MTTAIVAEVEYPKDASVQEQFEFLLQYAVRAPSGHNTQPWLFRLSASHIDVLADRTRSLPVVDPFDRELSISCGAAIDHLAVAASYFGRQIQVDYLVDPADPDLLARISLGPRSSGDVTRATFDAMMHRSTTRAAFEDRQVPGELIDRCRSEAQQQGIQLTLISEREKRMEVGELVAEGDRIQFADKRFRQELADWVRTRHSSGRDGMSGSAFGMPDFLSRVGALAIRALDLGRTIAAGDRQKISDASPTLAVFSSPGDETHDWLNTGRALSRVLLTLAASGVLASYLNQPIEVEKLRSRLASSVSCTGYPQLLMRFGYGKPCVQAVRRPVHEVLIS